MNIENENQETSAILTPKAQASPVELAIVALQGIKQSLIF